MNPELRIKNWMSERNEHLAPGANCHRTEGRIDQSVTHGLRRLICTPSRDRDSWSQIQLDRDVLAKHADDIGRNAGFWKNGPGKIEIFNHIVCPNTLADVKDPGRRGV